MFAITIEDSVPRFQLKALDAVLTIPLTNSFRTRGYGLIGNTVPTSYVIDRSGIVRYAQSGAFEPVRLTTVPEPLLAEPPAS